MRHLIWGKASVAREVPTVLTAFGPFVTNILGLTAICPLPDNARKARGFECEMLCVQQAAADPLPVEFSKRLSGWLSCQGRRAAP
jgi:hypothetical protein